MKLHRGEMVKLIDVLYVLQEVKNILSVSRIILKGYTMKATQDKITIKINSFNMILDARKEKMIAQCYT